MITNDWYSNIDNGLLNGVLFLYLKKSFDRMDHKILNLNIPLLSININSLTQFTTDPDIKIDGRQMDRVKSHRYLGIKIDALLHGALLLTI